MFDFKLAEIANRLKKVDKVTHVKITGNYLTFRYDENRPIHVFKSRKHSNSYVIEHKGMYSDLVHRSDLSVKTILKRLDTETNNN